MKKSSKVYKLDLFAVLKNIQKKKRTFFGSLSEDEKKEVVPHLIMRWLTGSNNPTKIDRLNNYVNILVPGPGGIRRHYIKTHPNLIYFLLLAAMDGREERMSWLPVKKKKVESSKALDVIKRYFRCSTIRAKEYIELLKDDDIISYAEQLALQPNEMKVLDKELNAKRIPVYL